MTDITLERLRARLAERSAVRADATGRSRAAVALVIAAGGSPDVPALLLIKRADTPGDPWSGQMALPGGRHEPDDADLLATAIRETQEEIGVALETSDLIGVLDDLAPVARTLPPVIVRPFVFWLPQKPHTRRSREVAFHLWVSLEDLPQSAGVTSVRVRGTHLRVPAYLIGEHVVWGMTHRILLNLMTLCL